MLRFADFEVDPAAGILSRQGTRVRLQDLPFRLLLILLHRSGAVVTRDELRKELWGAETFVDAEAGLNTAIAKLREALRDSAEAPRFIETLPKRGYRFIGTVAEVASPAAVGHRPTSAGPMADRGDESAPRQPPRRFRWPAAGALAAALAVAAAGYCAFAGPDSIAIAVVRFHNETGDAAHDRLAESLTDAVVVALAGNPRYGVIGNSPLLRTDRIFQDVRRIAGALKADYVVLGQLQIADTGLVARAHFIRASDQKHLWADRIDLDAVAAPEGAVTAAVSAGVAVGLSR